MEEEEAVLRFRDGRVLHGRVAPRDDFGEGVPARTDEGEELITPLSALKAVFFLRDSRQRALEIERRRETTNASVEFADGEVLHGRLELLDLSRPGFTLLFDDPASSSARAYVVTAAINSLEFRP